MMNFMDTYKDAISYHIKLPVSELNQLLDGEATVLTQSQHFEKEWKSRYPNMRRDSFAILYHKKYSIPIISIQHKDENLDFRELVYEKCGIWLEDYRWDDTGDNVIFIFKTERKDCDLC